MPDEGARPDASGESPSPGASRSPSSAGAPPSEPPLTGDGGGDAAPVARIRSRYHRFSYTVVRRVNLAGLLLLAAAAAAADFLSVGNLFWSTVLTATEAFLALPWSWTVMSMDTAESRLLDAKRFGRFRRLGSHAVTFAAMAAVLVSKTLLIHRAETDQALAAFAGPYRNYVVFFFVLFGAGLVGRGSRLARVLGSLADHPARLMAISFAIVALLGGFLLTLPVSLVHAEQADFVDGLFTSMSAVCVTGLVVNDVCATYTGFGQAVICVLIQAGGLGIMVLTAAFAILAGRRFQARSTQTLTEMIDAESFAVLRRTIRHIFVFTIVIEALGAFLLWVAFSGVPEVAAGPEHASPIAGAGSTVWSAVFHSVSAFCNAGFSLSHGNLAGFMDATGVLTVIGSLIVLGGLGFPVLDELWNRWRHKRVGVPTRRLSLHARTVLLSTAALLVLGAAGYLVLEWEGELRTMSWDDRLLTAAFASVTARTAGFNSWDYGKLGAPAVLFTTLLMFIGASPGSTGGGIKTTTAATLLAAFRAEIRGSSQPRLLDRAVPDSVGRKAAAVAVGSGVLVAGAWFLLLVTENHDPLRIFFEVVSAFATCGLSTGITAGLSVAGKVIVTLLMFVGRIGPITLALAVVARPRVEHFTVPEERVLIG